MSASQSALIIPAIGQDLVLVKRPIPLPGENQVQIKVEIVGINPHESKSKSVGLFVKDTLPTPIGVDILGTVTKLGPGVTKFKEGDLIFGFGDPQQPEETGSQEYCLLTVTQAAHVPENVSHEEAVTFPLNALTSFLALFDNQGLGIPPPFTSHRSHQRPFDYASQSIVIIGGGSATGKFAIELARVAGFGHIIAIASLTSSSLLTSLGATHVFDRRLGSDEINDQVRSVVGDSLIYALDCVGGGKGGQTLGARLLSNSKRGTLAVLIHHGSVDETLLEPKHGRALRPTSSSTAKLATLAEQIHGVVSVNTANAPEHDPGYDRKPVICAPKYFRDTADLFWGPDGLVKWIRNGQLQPTTFDVAHGLDAKRVNDVLDAYNAEKPVVKLQLHL